MLLVGTGSEGAAILARAVHSEDRPLAVEVVPARGHPPASTTERGSDEGERTAMPARFKDLVLDAVDHQALADWWCVALGYVRRETTDGTRPTDWPVPICDPSGSGPIIWVNAVPEPKSVKNRMHLDVWGSTEELVELGATLVRPRGGDIEWDVLADPEGNEFCVFAPSV